MSGSKNLTYNPKPIPIENVEIGAHLNELIECLSKNAHDIWAIQRIADNWSWGETRCDIKKEHPCLVHFDELPESEKQYDRKMVVGTLKAIIALGYEIKKSV